MASLCFWNEFELKKPPLITVQVEETGFGEYKQVMKMFHSNKPLDVALQPRTCLSGSTDTCNTCPAQMQSNSIRQRR